MSNHAKILLAEDDICSAHYLKQLLIQMGYEVTGVVQAGEEVIEKVAKEQPDLILMDISLGGKIDGISAAEKVHAQFDVPVIYLTAHTDDEIFERAKVTEPYAYLIKPFDINQLRHAIEIALFKHHFEKEICQLNSELNKANRELRQEIVLREKVEKQLRHKANHDHLTGLPNRVLLFDRLKQAFAFDERHKNLLALMILDLDDFKNINDTMGHLTGDILLKKVALGLQKCMRQYDTVGRIGGDEFVIIVNDINSIQDIIKFAEKIQGIFQQPFDILGQPTSVTTSIGVAVYPLHGTKIETLMKKADMAMYAAKKDGRNTFRFFSDSMNFEESAQKIMKIKRRITNAEGTTIRNFLSNIDVKSEKDRLAH